MFKVYMNPSFKLAGRLLMFSLFMLHILGVIGMAIATDGMFAPWGQ
jgi:hypothetical protein